MKILQRNLSLGRRYGQEEYRRINETNENLVSDKSIR